MTSPWQTLSNALCPWLAPALDQFEAARRDEHLGHAWLISGPAGSGKINLALVLARRLLGSETAPITLDPDAALVAFAARHEPMDRHPDLHWLHPEDDKETISVEQVRDVIDALALTAHRGGAKVVIVEPAEAMTAAAANALLKTLEEPTRDSYLLLLSHRPGRLPATIRSRCQQVKIGAPGVASLADWLRVGPEVVASARATVGAAPIAVATAIKDNSHSFFKELQSDLIKLCEDRVEVQTVAQAWLKDQPQLALGWLIRRLHGELRRRAGAGSTEVTDPGAATLHNALRGLPTRTLFDAFEKADQLLNLQGSGLNVELALQALLSAFVMNRGRS
jgi:DNA polymerase III subunit delta'